MINHFNAVRLRVTGAGNLKGKLYSQGNNKTQDLVPLVLESTTERSKTQLCNFSQERVFLEIKTTEINETFVITSILVFVKPKAESYPQ